MAILGLDGKPLKKGQRVETEDMEQKTVPVVGFKEYILPMRVLTNDKVIPANKEAVSPLEIVNEYRAMYQEMQDRFSILAIGLSLLAKGNPDIKEFLDSVGLTLRDFQGKPIYEPELKKEEPPETHPSEKDSSTDQPQA